MPQNVRIYFPGISKSKIAKAVNSTLPKNKAVNDFGLIFVSSRRMAELNKKYRAKEGPTSVLSFTAYNEPRPGWGTGDVVICPSVVKKEAEKAGFTQKKWMTWLIVHGILHLAGYDHKTQKDRIKMEKLEDKVLKKLGL